MSDTQEAEVVDSSKPALLEHCMAIYDAMHERSEEYLEHDYSDMEEPPRLYKGMLTKLFVRLDYGIANYSRIMTMMRDMGSVEQIRRGAGKTPGMWLLWRRPDMELYTWVKDQQAKRTEEEKIMGDSVEQRLRDMQGLVLDLRSQLDLLEERVEILEEEDDND